MQYCIWTSTDILWFRSTYYKSFSFYFKQSHLLVFVVKFDNGLCRSFSREEIDIKWLTVPSVSQNWATVLKSLRPPFVLTNGRSLSNWQEVSSVSLLLSCIITWPDVPATVSLLTETSETAIVVSRKTIIKFDLAESGNTALVHHSQLCQSQRSWRMMHHPS